MNLTGEVRSVDGLDAITRTGMLVLMQAHFSGVSVRQFHQDLAEKTHALLLRDAHGCIRGFTTLKLDECLDDGETIHVVRSGDTIVAPEAWNSMALPRTWLRFVFDWTAQHPNAPHYWLLICSGYRTYRFMPVFWKVFCPRFDGPSDPALEARLHRLSGAFYGQAYDPATGIVRLAEPQILREDLAEVAAVRLKNPHVDFFLRRNPGYVQGDELVCLSELTLENLTRAGHKLLGQQACVVAS